MATNEMIAYWVTSSDRDYQVMIDLFQKGHYTWSLFIGHLVIEKLLKAVCSQIRSIKEFRIWLKQNHLKQF